MLQKNNLNNIIAIKFDNTGKVKYEETIVRKNGEIYPVSVCNGNNGGFAIIGDTNTISDMESDMLFLKFDEGGKFLLAKSSGGKNSDFASSITETKENSFIISGDVSVPYGNSSIGDFALLKVSNSGNIINNSGYEIDISKDIVTEHSKFAIKKCLLEPQKLQLKVIRFKVGTLLKFNMKSVKLPWNMTIKPGYGTITLNGIERKIYPVPFILPKWSRTVIPVRNIFEALGGLTGWDGSQKSNAQFQWNNNRALDRKTKSKSKRSNEMDRSQKP